MTKLLVFGDTDAPMFQIISEASHRVDWVEVELVEENLSQVVEFKEIFDAATYFGQFLR